MASHYLIDYENVREAGVNYCHHAEEGDVIYLIYTSNASKIGLDALANMKAAVKVIKVAAGKQSLDMHLISMLGFLIHKNGSGDHYIVISKDTGYDSVLRYWSAQGYKAERITGTRELQVKEPQAKEPPMKAPSANEPQGQEQKGKKQETKKPEAKKPEVKKPEVKKPEEKKPEEKKPEAKKTEEKKPEVKAPQAAQPEASPVKKPEPKEASEDEAVKQSAAEDTAKKQAEIESTKQETPTAGELRKRLNGRLMSILSKEKVDSKVAGQIASLAVKNMGTREAKRTIYLSLLQKFGQKQGLAYYSLIKKEL